MKKIFAVIIALLMGWFLLTNPKVVSEAVGGAIKDCLEVIVPSLFAFSALAGYLQKSGLYRTALKPLTFLLSKILRLDEELCGVFLLANIGGYPVGASLLSELVREGRLDGRAAGRMLCCCFGSGPSFVIGIVGMRVFGSAGAGAALFAACFMSSVVMAAFVGRTGEKIVLRKAEKPDALTAECFIVSVNGAARVMFSVCTMIVGFSVIAAALREWGVNAVFERIFEAMGLGANSKAVFPALMEVTRIKAVSPGGTGFTLCAALLSLGGVCVALQITALCRDIPLKMFLLTRLPAAAISAGAAFALSFALPQPDAETLAQAARAVPFTHGAVLSVCVLVMSGILLAENSAGLSEIPASERAGWL